MPESWNRRAELNRRLVRQNRKNFRGDSDGKTVTPSPVPDNNRVRRPTGGALTIFVQPDDPEETDGVQEIGCLWFDTDEPVP